MSITTGECFKCSHVKCTLTNVTLEDETFWRERNKWREVGDVLQEDDDCRCSGLFMLKCGTLDSLHEACLHRSYLAGYHACSVCKDASVVIHDPPTPTHRSRPLHTHTSFTTHMHTHTHTHTHIVHDPPPHTHMCTHAHPHPHAHTNTHTHTLQ